MLPQAIGAAVLALGCIVGSFLNVVIYRLPKMEGYWREVSPPVGLPILQSHPRCVGDHTVALPLPVQSTFNLAWPGSACPACGNPIAWYDNIPILSWVALGGRCRKCKAPISARYPAVEIATGLLLLCVYLKFGLT
ncbi:MAG: A24 family peptidase, partial [Cyanobacteria bacterium REEB65]|nr:A24 family peptidase [Cyanobacteria bacterium REEB65]